jgi:hypothetical protein
VQLRVLDRRNAPVRGQTQPEHFLSMLRRRLDPRIDFLVRRTRRIDRLLRANSHAHARRLDHQSQTSEAMRLASSQFHQSEMEASTGA